MPSLLLVARDLTKGNPDTPDAYLAIAQALAVRVGRRLIEDDRTLVAYVNAGRWIADCPYCASGIMLDPLWPLAACLGAGCHRVYRSLAWPDEAPVIEEVLAVRAMKHQHWGYERGISRDVETTAESVEDLERENEEHLVIPRRAERVR